MNLRRDLAAGASADLAGRDPELSTVVDFARAAAAGAGQAVLLRGPAGIGKTKLVATALDELDAVAAVTLSARCPEDGATAYGAVRSLFDPLHLTENGESAAGLLSGSARLALPALVPGRLAEPATASTYSVMHGLHWLTAGLTAEGLVVLAVDDVQWCDEASLRWLGFLLRRAENLPLLILLTQRTGSELPAAAALEEIAGLPNCRTIDLPPLTVDAVGELLGLALAAVPDRLFAEKCGEVTGGNPFLLEQVVGTLRRTGTAPERRNLEVLDELGRTTVAKSVLGRLPGEAHAVARAIAVLGGEQIDTVAALARTHLWATESAVRALRTNDLLAGNGLGFGHDLIRQAVLDEIPPAELAALRERAATLLNDAGRTAEEVSVQLLLLPGPPQPWMTDVLRDAAVSAESRGAPAVAARYLAKVLEVDRDDPKVLVRVARVLAQVDPGAALRHLERALDVVRDPRTRVEIAVQYGLTSLTAQNCLRAYELLGTTIDELNEELGDRPSEVDRALRMLAEATLVTVGMDEKSTVGKVGARFRDRTPPPGDTAEERQMLAMLAALGALEAKPAALVAEQALHVLRIGDVSVGGWALLGATLPLYLADQNEPALTALNQLIAHAQERGEAWTYWLTASTRSMAWLWTGNLGEALSDAQSSYDVVTQERWAGHATMPQTALATVLVHQGEAVRAEEILDGIVRPRFDQFSLEYHWFLMARAKARLALGDPEGALRQFRRCGESLREGGIACPVLAPWWFDAACLLAELGRFEEGWEIADANTEPAERWGTARAVGMARTARGMLTGGKAGVALLTEGAETLAASPAKLEQARVEYYLGCALLRAGDAEAARDRLRRSIDLAVLSRDRRQVDLSLAALGAAGGRMRRGTSSPSDALTGSERRVAARAAAGATNREIAESLFLTVRTVELHLTSAYRKLGVKGRAELAGSLGENAS
ncbi:ATP-binding protein [Amycolatopsis nigrescens]|uniref:ATP-binding protein n=1 Tax=Amycolatopsis nigrescens TaxID=381445 RepID=UPI000377DE04|nr:AAA family ATPase [Amycolatopsis nigrescens]